jgi:hypothetical protein
MSDYWGTTPQQPDQPNQPGQPNPPAPDGSAAEPEFDRWGAPVQGRPEVLSSQSGAYSSSAPTAGASAYATAGPPTYLGATGDILGAVEPAPRGGGKRRLAAIGIGVVAVAGIGVGAAFAAGAFGGSGAQPDGLVPATAVGYVSVDLDPSLGQKVDALRFLRKFPAAKASLGSTDDLRKWVFEQATKDDASLSQLSYDRDVKPWIGDRFGLAVVPGATAGAEPSVVVVIQVSDEGKASAGLKKLIKDPSDGTCAVAKGYAVCAETPAILSTVQAAAAKHSLADDPNFKSDVSSAGSRGIALAWGDLGKVAQLVPNAGQALGGSLGAAGNGLGGLGGISALGGRATAGRMVASVRFEGANLEVTGKVVGVNSTTPVTKGGTGVEQLPDKTLVAFGGALAPKAVDTAYRSMQDQLKAVGGTDLAGGFERQLAQMGFHLPQDLDSLLGTRIDVAFGGLDSDHMPLVGIRSNADAVKAAAVLDRVSSQLNQAGAPFTLHHLPAGKGYAAALSPASRRASRRPCRTRSRPAS